jgi:hypothetical protein
MADDVCVKKAKHSQDKRQIKGSDNDRLTNSESCETTDDEVQQVKKNRCKNADEDRPAQTVGHVKHSCNNLTVDSAVTRSGATCADTSCRLLIVSSKIKNSSVMQSAILPNVVLFLYKYESSTLDSCLGEFLK